MNIQTLINYYEQEKKKKIREGKWNHYTENQHNMALVDIARRFSIEEGTNNPPDESYKFDGVFYKGGEK